MFEKGLVTRDDSNKTHIYQPAVTRQKTQKQFQQLEEKIVVLTKQKITLEGALATPEVYTDHNKFTQTEAEYKKVSEQLHSANLEYEVVFEKMMTLEGKA